MLPLLRHSAALLLLIIAPTAAFAQTDEEAIAAQSKRFSQAYVDGDIETLLSIYTSDGVAIPGGRDYMRGRDALRKYWSMPEGVAILRHSATPVELIVDGDHAYDWGYYEGQSARNGEPLDPFRGMYTIIWNRGEDGVWRMAVDMWASLPPKKEG